MPSSHLNTAHYIESIIMGNYTYLCVSLQYACQIISTMDDLTDDQKVITPF